ncbi:MAG: hypothetical protein MUP71_10675 [Candidatus Aminicenantes bacterium]|nr:hypothetical protein [Candidatus Aminicenantes bacterium]
MEKLQARLPKLVALARWLAFLVIVIVSGAMAWKVIGIWQASLGLLPNLNNAIVGITAPWHPFYTFLLTCFLCVLGAVPMLRERRSLSVPRLVFELAYTILALYLLYTIHEVLFASFSTAVSGPLL